MVSWPLLLEAVVRYSLVLECAVEEAIHQEAGVGVGGSAVDLNPT